MQHVQLCIVWVTTHVQNLPEQAQLLVQEQQAGGEGVHAAQHQRVVRVVVCVVPWGPAPL